MDKQELLLKMIISSWETQNARMNKLLDVLTDDQLLLETAPGRNTGIYLLGHLTAVSDGMSTFLGWGNRLYPQLEEVFIKNPDKSGLAMPAPATVREYWNKVNANVSKHISQMSPDEWFSKHTAISDEDFAKEPFRNKLNIIINRTNHISYHFGQLVYLVKK